VSEAKSFVDSGDLTNALACMEQARDLQPSDDTILFRLGSLNFDLKRYDLARNYAQEAVALAPSEWVYQYLLGLADSRSGHWQEARASLEIAVRLKPDAADAYNALGEAALQQRDFKRAISSFQSAAQLDPKQPAYQMNLDAARKAAGQKF
jgi:Flp pilus assembly protein TadD